MTTAKTRNTRKPSTKNTQALYQADQSELTAIKRNILNRPSNGITLNQHQLDHYIHGDGLFIYGPEGNTVAFISVIPDDTDSDVKVVDQPRALETLDKLVEARAKLHLLQMLVVNQNGYLELNETAIQGLAGVLSDVQDAMVSC